jgi:hypothetical protein
MNRQTNEVCRSAENTFGKQVQLCALNDTCSFRTGHVSRNVFRNLKCFQELSTRDGAAPAAATQVCARFSAVMKANMDYVFGIHITDSIRVPPT